MYNRTVLRKDLREKRIVVVVDEIAELMPTFKGKANSDLMEINSTLNRIARMGRAIGINLVIGVQKPDARNLDPTIKANLSGVLCFAVSHFTQSTIVLGNSRAADLNKEYKGRAIWKRGLEFIEVQTPLLTEEEVIDVQNRIAGHWKEKSEGPSEVSQIKLKEDAVSKNPQAWSATAKVPMEMESAQLHGGKKTLFRFNVALVLLPKNQTLNSWRLRLMERICKFLNSAKLRRAEIHHFVLLTRAGGRPEAR